LVVGFNGRRRGFPFQSTLAIFDVFAQRFAGADDYLTKPFDVDESMARIRANVRPGQDGAEPPVTVGALSFDLRAHEAFVGGRPLVLHRRELDLLEALVRRVGRTTPRETLILEFYGGEGEPLSNALDALISRVRKHLSEKQGGGRFCRYAALAMCSPNRRREALGGTHDQAGV
jgi:DNA-binding response OmpR family regulator